MTEGSGLYLAGPALVKAAIGQVVDPEELGGAKMHAEISGTVDFLEPDDRSCIERLRHLTALLPSEMWSAVKVGKYPPARDPKDIYALVNPEEHTGYDAHALIDCVIDAESWEEYKADYGKAMVVGFARIDGIGVGVVANQRNQTTTGKGEVEIGGVIYSESADKTARFVMDCNQMGLPILFFQDVMGFMVGKEAEQSGIIRSGAKLVNVLSNSVVPKITVVVGNSFGAGNYALCGKAYDPNFILAWPNARFAVMGADQAADTLFAVQKKAAERRGAGWNKEKAEQVHAEIKQKYEAQMDIRYGAARGWVDAIIEPHQTRDVLSMLLPLVQRGTKGTRSFHTGVIQV
jgi:acetyl-CoA carboxylase carboxyltransferase component